MNAVQSFLGKVFNTVNPAIAFIAAIGSYLMFPEKSFVVWAIAVWVAAGLDIFTRCLAIFIKSNGMWKAFKSRTFNSDTFFRKTAVKVVAYLVIQILAGLSMRMISFQSVNTAAASIIYIFLFFREFASNLENLIECGAEDLRPLLFWVKKKEKEIFKNKEK